MASTATTPWETVEASDASSDPRPETRDPIHAGGLFTIPLIALGVGLIALCLLIPAADENRRLSYERQKLQADLDQIEKQVATNNEFLKRLADDPTLLERLARRQMKMVREGTKLMELDTPSAKPADMSPFLLVTVPPPAPMPPYKPIGGLLSAACRQPKVQLYLIGASLLMIATGVVLSSDKAAV